MRPVQHKSNTRVLAAPPKHDQKQLTVNAMPITDTTVGDRHAIVVFYELNDEERAQIARGALIGVWVLGVTMPPMALSVQEDK
jgi:hypothetical protein